MSDPEYKYAWVSGRDVVVSLSECDPSFTALTVETAKIIVEQLTRAIEEASDTPFERWWRGLRQEKAFGGTYRIALSTGTGPLVNKEKAQVLFDEIRAVK